MITTTSQQQCHRRKTGHLKDQVSATGETPSLLERFDEIRQNEVEISHFPFDNAAWEVNKEFLSVDIFEIVVMALIVIPQLLFVSNTLSSTPSSGCV